MTKRPNLTGFAEAAYDQNSIVELLDTLRDGIVDQTDCDNWKISHQEWRDAICDAILARVMDNNRLPQS